MADEIKGKDIFADDALTRIADVANALDGLGKILAEDIVKNIKKLNSVKFETSQSIKDANKEARDLSSTLKAAAQAEKAKSDAEAAGAKVSAAKLKVEQELNKEKVAAQKLIQEEIKTKLAQSRIDKDAIRNKEKVLTLYQQESKRLNDLRKVFKDLALSEKDGTDEAKKLLEEITKLDTKLKKVDAKSGQFQRNVGNYPKQPGFGAQAASFAGNVVGPVAIGAAVGSAFTDAIEANSKFEASLKNLSAITGAEGKDLEFYSKKARELGLTTKGGAVAVVEAYKLIGSAKPELLQNKEALNEVTQQAILLSKAAGLELPDAATRLTDALNQFGAPASEAAKYVDILAAGAKAGAAEVPEVTDALLKFGVAAKSSNISIQESVGSIELLAEKGLKGADAGTALRNVFAKLSAAKILPPEAKKELAAAGVDIKKLSDNSLPLASRLKELSKIQGNAAAITRVFGLENKTAGEVLISNIPRLEELTKAVNENGVAADQAAKNTDTFDQKIIEAKNGYTDLLLEITQGDFSVITKFFVDNTIAQFDELKKEFKTIGVLFKEGFSGLKNLAEQNGVDEYIRIQRMAYTTLNDEQKKAKADELKNLNKSTIAFLKAGKVKSEEELKILDRDVRTRLKLIAILEGKEVDLKTGPVAPVVAGNVDDGVLTKAEEAAKKKKDKAIDDADKEAQAKRQKEIDDKNEQLKKQLSEEEYLAKIQQDHLDEIDENARKEHEKKLLAEHEFKKRLDDEKQVQREKDIQDIKHYLSKTLDLIDQELQKEAQLKQEALDKDLERRNQSIETERNLAERGLENTLAFEEEQKAKTELDKEQEKKKALRQQKAINFLKAYGSYLDNGKNPGEALTRAATDQVLADVISAAFFEGAENIEQAIGRPHLKGRDGYIVRVDGSERVMTGEQNKMVGDMSNWDLANLAAAYQDGQYLPTHAMNMDAGSVARNMVDSASLMQLVNMNKRMESLERTIANKKETHISLNNLGEVVRKEVENGITKIMTYKKSPTRLG